MICILQLFVDVEYDCFTGNGIQTTFGWPLLFVLACRGYEALKTRFAVAMARSLHHLLGIKVIKAGDAFATLVLVPPILYNILVVRVLTFPLHGLKSLGCFLRFSSSRLQKLAASSPHGRSFPSWSRSHRAYDELPQPNSTPRFPRYGSIVGRDS